MRQITLNIEISNSDYEKWLKAANNKGLSIEDYYASVLSSNKYEILPKWFLWFAPLISGLVIGILARLF